jgi:hypothetical protein
MTTHRAANAVGDTATVAPARTPILSFASYGEAERAVEYLATHDFPVDRVAIVGVDVRLVEQIVGRTNYGTAALHGAGSGALTGVLFGWIFGLLTWIHPLIAGLTLAVYGLVFGAIVGALIGLGMYALRRGRRDFESVQVWLPERHELVVDAEVADEARALLTQRGSGGV